MSAERERAVSAAFVAIANTLAGGYDAVELFTRLTADCARLLDIASAGLLLADQRGVLHLMAATPEGAADLELFQLQREQGPCLDCPADAPARGHPGRPRAVRPTPPTADPRPTNRPRGARTAHEPCAAHKHVSIA